MVSARAWDGALRTQLSLLYLKDTEQISDSVIEIQAFIVEIIGKFELTMTDQSERICRAPCVVMVPMIDGELERGSQLPLVVSIAARENNA